MHKRSRMIFNENEEEEEEKKAIKFFFIFSKIEHMLIGNKDPLFFLLGFLLHDKNR